MLHATLARSAALAAALAALQLPAPALHAQPHEPLRHEGELHRDFTRSISARYRSTKPSSRKGGSKSYDERRAAARREDFAFRNAIALSQQHQSGQVLSGDWVSAAVRRLGERVAAADREMQGGKGPEVRFYVLTSPAVNAFATADRTVYVTMGLLARLESEAQLAFILSHELGHVSLDHNFDLYVKSEELSVNTRANRRRQREDPFAINRYSRTNEEAADDYGLELYRRLGYGGEEAVGAFELLKDSYLSFGGYGLDPADLDVLDYRADAGWTLPALKTPRSVTERLAEEEARREEEAEEARRAAEKAKRGGLFGRRRSSGTETADAPETPEGREDDNPSTHPAITERLGKAETALAGLAGAGFDVWTPALLDSIRRQARYEVVDYLMAGADYPEAIAEVLSLRREDAHPDTAFVRRVLTQALLHMTVYKQLHERLAEERAEELAARPSRRRGGRPALPEPEEADDFIDASDSYGETQRVYHLFDTATVAELADLSLAQAVAFERDHPTLSSARAFTDRALELQYSLDDDALDAWRTSYPAAARALAALPGPDGETHERRLARARRMSDLEAVNEANAERLEANANGRGALGARRVLVAMPAVKQYDRRGDSPKLREANEASTLAQAKAMTAAMRATGVRGDVLAAVPRRGAADDLEDIRQTRQWVSQYLSYAPLRLVPHNHDRMLAALEAREAEKVVFALDERYSYSGAGMGAAELFLYSVVNPYAPVASMFSRRHTGRAYHLVLDPAALSIDLAEGDYYASRQGAVSERARLYALFTQISRKSH